jgi:hypothetical protein
LIPINSIEQIFSGASWWECEIWDMFGVFFLNQHSLARLLTDYGFQGYERLVEVVTFFLFLANKVIWVTIQILMFLNLNQTSEKHSKKRLSRRAKSIEILKNYKASTLSNTKNHDTRENV